VQSRSEISLSDKFEEISSLKNFGEVQRNVCWLFDLELAIIGSGYLLLALSRHPDLIVFGWQCRLTFFSPLIKKA
jgi:hypothetical protein